MSSAGTKSDRARGLWIAFYGPDGVGKSAVVELLHRQVGGEFAGCTRFHFRPHFGRGDFGSSPVTAPHAQPPRGLLVSLGKLLYWLLDCWIGYLLFVWPRRRRSQLVIFDRYFPDIVVDPARYRLPSEAMRVAAALAELAPRPDVSILLDAPAEAVQQRKREVSLAESRRQRWSYLEMFRAAPRAIVINADCRVDEVTRNVAGAVCRTLVIPPHSQALCIANPKAD